MKKWAKRINSFLLIVTLMITSISIPAYAENEEIFPDDSIVEVGELSTGEEETFPDDSDSMYYNDDDLNDTDELEIPEDADSLYTTDDSELGSGEEIFPDGSDSEYYSDEELGTDNENPELGEASEITGDDDDIELGASSPSLGLSASAIVVGPGQSSTVKLTCQNYSGSVYLQYAMSNSSLVSASWGGWSGNSINLTIKQKGSGTGYIYVYMKAASTGKTLYTTKILVTAYTSIAFNASSTSVSVTKGGASKITMSYSGYSGSVYMQYSITNSNAFGCSWGNWSGSSIPITVTGKNVGSGYVYVYLKSATTNATLASKTIKVAVTSKAKLSLSTTSVSVAKGSNSVVRATYSNYSGTVYMSYAKTQTTAFSCSWGNWSGTTVPLTVTGKSAGSGYVYIYLKNASTNETLASTSFKVTVTDNAKVTVSSSSVSIATNGSKTIKCTVSGMSGTYYLAYSTTNTVAYSCSWANSWSGSSINLTITGKNIGTGTVTIYLKNSSGTTIATVCFGVTVYAGSSPTLTASTTSLSLKTGNASQVRYTFS
ncbi:MAG: hypothetical protein ACI4TK_11995, partial [Agathobacter sp.]